MVTASLMNGAHPGRQTQTWLRLGLLLAIQVAVFYPTYWSMVLTWYRSETFAHGFFIFPISLYLIWRNRDVLCRTFFTPDWKALPIIAGLGFVWMLARLTDVQVVQQFAVVIMLPALMWALLGWRAVSTIAFPLAFLLFAVPVGEFLIYPMMKFTATFTVNAVRLTGIPVYWEGMFFSLPSGRWSIVEGCSGVRYIIASVTLGTLYAYLTYNSYWRRAAFILLSIIFPIIANGLRAYMIVMIGHLSGMKLATGVDHLIYGWVWFGVVMFILFWIGSFWSDRKGGAENTNGLSAQPGGEPNQGEGSLRQIFSSRGVTTGALVLVLVWPLWANYAVNSNPSQDFRVAVPAVSGSWHELPSPVSDWTPRYIKPSQTIHTAYRNTAGSDIGLYLAFYANQHQGKELINSQNVMVVQKHPIWRQPFQSPREQTLDNGRSHRVIESRLKSDHQSLLIWHWNYIGEQHLSDPVYGKMLEAWRQLLGHGRNGTGIVVYTEYKKETLEDARQRLTEFVNDMLTVLESRLAE